MNGKRSKSLSNLLDTYSNSTGPIGKVFSKYSIVLYLSEASWLMQLSIRLVGSYLHDDSNEVN